MEGSLIKQWLFAMIADWHLCGQRQHISDYLGLEQQWGCPAGTVYPAQERLAGHAGRRDANVDDVPLTQSCRPDHAQHHLVP